LLKTYTLEQGDIWNNIVKSFDCYDVCYLKEYAAAFFKQGEGTPLLVYCESSGARAMNVIFIRDIAEDSRFRGVLEPGQYFDISTPYGYGGFWMEGEAFETVNEEYENFCIANGFITEFVRFHLFSAYEKRYFGAVESHTQNVVCALSLSEEELLRSFEHKVRKNIRRAEENHLSVLVDTSGDRLSDFLGLYYDTMRRTGAEERFFFSEDFFAELNKMKDQFAYFFVLDGQDVVSTELVLFGSENSYSFLGGTRAEAFHLRPNDFLKFHIIKWCKEKGLKRYILGGGYGSDDGIFKYKRSFAPYGVVPFYIGKKVFSPSTYDKLMGLRGEDLKNSGFFPGYRG